MSGHLKRAIVNVAPGPKAVDRAIMAPWPSTHQVKAVDTVAVRLSQLGEVSAVWFVITIAAFLVGHLTTGKALVAVAGIVFEWVLTNRVVKAFVWRQRPTPEQPDPRGVRRPSSSSLPSGHSSASAFAATFVGGMCGWWPWMAVLAFFLGCSRAHLRVHYPTDVIAGWLWGFGLGTIVLALTLTRV